MTEAEAELLAIRALSWLAGNDELWPGFLAASGAAPAELAKLAADPAFLAGVLEFLTQSDAMVMAFCDAEHLPYAAPLAARRALPGGDEVNWT